MKITITLPRETKSAPPFDRATPGTLVLADDDGHKVLRVSALGKGGGNKVAFSKNWLLPKQDTPPGTYVGKVTGPWAPLQSFGSQQVVSLTAIGGGALKAKQQGGRVGLAIHGGGDRLQELLYGTFGCVRLLDDSQAQLIRLLVAAEVVEDIPVEIIEV